MEIKNDNRIIRLIAVLFILVFVQFFAIVRMAGVTKSQSKLIDASQREVLSLHKAIDSVVPYAYHKGRLGSDLTALTNEINQMFPTPTFK